MTPYIGKGGDYWAQRLWSSCLSKRPSCLCKWGRSIARRWQASSSVSLVSGGPTLLWVQFTCNITNVHYIWGRVEGSKNSTSSVFMFQARYATLIHHMGGSIRKEFSANITHVIAKTTRGDKYRYAADMGLPILSEDWLENAWSKRYDNDFHATVGLVSSSPHSGYFFVCFEAYHNFVCRCRTSIVCRRSSRATWLWLAFKLKMITTWGTWLWKMVRS